MRNRSTSARRTAHERINWQLAPTSLPLYAQKRQRRRAKAQKKGRRHRNPSRQLSPDHGIGPLLPRLRPALTLRSSGPVNIQGLRPFFASHDVEDDLVAFMQHLEAISQDGGVMNENILAAFLRNETVP